MTIHNVPPPTGLLTSDFTYKLPERLIANEPASPRDSSRLLVADRASQTLEHRVFRDLTEYLRPADTLVINDSRVIPARLSARTARGSEVELLLLRKIGSDDDSESWSCLCGPGRRAREGAELTVTVELSATVERVTADGCRIIRFTLKSGGDVHGALMAAGVMPLPPYISRESRDDDRERYQTVYAKTEGSAAAPTAGLHFTDGLLSKIKDMGVAVAPVLLHVGIGTFRPVKERRIADHVMHTEYFQVSEETARTVNERRAAGGRIIAVGTTSCRTLESASDENGVLHASSGETGIFIYPGYKFKATDALITNFHLPQSTLLMLVSAFAGREFILRTYETAVEREYRFFSYGDAMLLL